MLMFLLVGTLALGLASVTSRQSALAPARADTISAFYAAEAGRDLAMRELALGVDEDGDGTVGAISDDDDDSTDPVISGARVVVTRESAGAAEILRSTGVAAAATRSLRATLTPGTGLGGFIRRETWASLPGGGGAISRLTGEATFPDTPSAITNLTSFEAPTDEGDHYGARVVGYLYPPTSGNYTFWIAGDDQAELWLSVDDAESNAVRIARAPGATASQEWDLYTEQESAVVALVAGQRYFIYALHVESGGADHLAVAWQGPGITQQVISGAYLSAP